MLWLALDLIRPARSGLASSLLLETAKLGDIPTRVGSLSAPTSPEHAGVAGINVWLIRALLPLACEQRIVVPSLEAAVDVAAGPSLNL